MRGDYCVRFMSFSKKTFLRMAGVFVLVLSVFFGAGFFEVSAATYKGKVVKSADGMVKGETTECELIGGSENAKFAFFLARTNDNSLSTLCSNYRPWAGSSNELSDYKSAVLGAVSKAESLLDGRGQSFAFYRSNKIFSSDSSDICPKILSSKNFIYTNNGWVMNGSGGAAANFFEAHFCLNGGLLGRSTALFHEQIGHGFASLMDEYGMSGGGLNVPPSIWPGYNCTNDSGCQKWKIAGNNLDEGCFEGCYPYAGTRYRSSSNSIMSDDRIGGSGLSKLQIFILDDLIRSDRLFTNIDKLFKESL